MALATRVYQTVRISRLSAASKKTLGHLIDFQPQAQPRDML